MLGYDFTPEIRGELLAIYDWNGTSASFFPMVRYDALADKHIGLEQVGDGLWNIVYYRTLLGRIDERTGQITGVEKV
jgi:hypothetical protein